MFMSRNKKNNVYPRKPQFYYIKVGFKGVKILQVCFRDDLLDFPWFCVDLGQCLYSSLSNDHVEPCIQRLVTNFKHFFKWLMT